MSETLKQPASRLYAAVWGDGRRGEVFAIPREMPALDLAKPLKPNPILKASDTPPISTIPALVERTTYHPFARIDNDGGAYSIICYSDYSCNFIEGSDLKTVAEAVKAGVVDG